MTKQATEVVTKLTAVPQLGQYARWRAPVCVSVKGVAEPYAEIVVGVIKKAAQTSRIELGRDKCEPNVIVAFAPNAALFAEEMAKRGGVALTAFASPRDKLSFRSSHLPIRWLYNLTPSDSYGRDVDGNQSAPGGLSSQNEDAGGITTSRYSASLIDTNLKVGISGALVVVDLKLSEGVPLVSVANYVARVIFAQTPSPPAKVQAPTILDLFDRPDAKTRAAELTAWDNAYLKALYSTPMNVNRFTQRQLMESRMVSLLQESSPR